MLKQVKFDCTVIEIKSQNELLKSSHRNKNKIYIFMMNFVFIIPSTNFRGKVIRDAR